MHYDRFSWLDAPNLQSNLYICTMQMSLAWRHQAKFGDSVIKYLKQLEDVAHEKKYIHKSKRKKNRHAYDIGSDGIIATGP